MLRDKNLIPLSHQHQHALALCVRLDRGLQAGEVDLEAWQAEIQQLYEQEIAAHFAAEEKDIFPAAAQIDGLQALVEQLLAEHTRLRELFSGAQQRTLDVARLRRLQETLSVHIRTEERQLFETMQKQMSGDELTRIGAALEKDLASSACLLPNQATRLRPVAKPLPAKNAKQTR